METEIDQLQGQEFYQWGTCKLCGGVEIVVRVYALSIVGMILHGYTSMYHLYNNSVRELNDGIIS